jgi:hypothetical protein
MYQEAGFLSTSLGATREFRLAPQPLLRKRANTAIRVNAWFPMPSSNIEVQMTSVGATPDHTIGEHTKDIEREERANTG